MGGGGDSLQGPACFSFINSSLCSARTPICMCVTGRGREFVLRVKRERGEWKGVWCVKGEGCVCVCETRGLPFLPTGGPCSAAGWV